MRREGQGTVVVLGFVKGCFGGGAVVVEEVGAGRQAGRERYGG